MSMMNNYSFWLSHFLFCFLLLSFPIFLPPHSLAPSIYSPLPFILPSHSPSSFPTVHLLIPPSLTFPFSCSPSSLPLPLPFFLPSPSSCPTPTLSQFLLEYLNLSTKCFIVYVQSTVSFMHFSVSLTQVLCMIPSIHFSV